MRPRDTQRSKVYSLSPGIKGQHLSLPECELLIIRAHHRYGLVWRGRVTDGRGTTSARGSCSRINLPVWARTPETVLHETAHAIVEARFGYTVAAHGPEFARVMLELWAWAKLDTLPSLRKKAREARVKVAQDAACIPPKTTHVRALAAARKRLATAKAEYNTAKAEVARIRGEMK